jgi:hypothetical protein
MDRTFIILVLSLGNVVIQGCIEGGRIGVVGEVSAGRPQFRNRIYRIHSFHHQHHYYYNY